MYLKMISVDGWRNYSKAQIELNPGLNMFTGGNGQGKTNLLEAIYFLYTGHSLRAAKLEELINWSANYFFLKGTVCHKGEHVLESGMARDGRRVQKIDGRVIEKQSELSELVTAVFFRPEDLSLVKEGPSLRRRFLNIELCQISMVYKHNLTQYFDVLRQRNALLKNTNRDNLVLDILTQKLVEISEPLVAKRRQFLEKLSILTRLAHRRLSNNQEDLGIVYCPSLDFNGGSEQVIKRFINIRSMESKYKTTLLGPHRDDFLLTLNESSLKNFGSQGQQRTAVLALRLAELELFRSHTGNYPLLLLDDVFSELDSKRRDELLEQTEGKAQTIITSTEPVTTTRKRRIFVVYNGTIFAKDDD